MSQDAFDISVEAALKSGKGYKTKQKIKREGKPVITITLPVAVSDDTTPEERVKAARASGGSLKRETKTVGAGVCAGVPGTFEATNPACSGDTVAIVMAMYYGIDDGK